MKIKWNKKDAKVDYFGETKIIKKDEIGKAISSGFYPGQYLVEFQNMRFYVMDSQIEFINNK
jgi:hypothetical protein